MIWKKGLQLRIGLLQRISRLEARNFSVGKALQKDHYEVLGVKTTASQTEIKNAYFELSKLYHPDRIAATDENVAKFRAITAAYEVLGNEQSRKLYDRGLISDSQKAVESYEGPVDPIIKFYKERQERERVKTGEEDFQSWMPKPKHGLSEKSDLYQGRNKKNIPNLNRQLYFLIGSTVMLMAYINLNTENGILPYYLKRLFLLVKSSST